MCWKQVSDYGSFANLTNSRSEEPECHDVQPNQIREWHADVFEVGQPVPQTQ